MVVYVKDGGPTIKCMGQARYTPSAGRSMRVAGRTIFSKVQEKKLFRMERFMKARIKMVNEMAKEDSCGVTRTSTRENSRTTTFTGMVDDILYDRQVQV